MKKSFTRLLSLVMLLGMLGMYSFGVDPYTPDLGDGAKKVSPQGATAYTKTTDKAMIIFKEAVVASTGAVRVSKDGNLVAVIYATDSRVSIKNDTVLVDLSALLEELKTITVHVDETAFKPADGSPAAFTSPISWGWMTGDYTAPTLKAVVPKKDAVVGDQFTYSLEMEFEDAGSVFANGGKVYLYKADGNIWDLIDVTASSTALSGKKLILTGLRALEDNTAYTVAIDAGVVVDAGLRADGKKNEYAGLSDRTKWTFSTEDFSAPGYATDYPKKGDVTNTTVSALVKTTEAGKTYAVISTSSTAPSADAIRNATTNNKSQVVVAGTEYSIVFDKIGGVNLSENTQYYIHIVTDNNDTPGTVVKTVNPKTTETVAPKLATVAYLKGSASAGTASVDGTTGVVTTTGAVNQALTKIVLTFTEDQGEVQKGAGNFIIRRVSDNADYLSIPVSALVINPANKLEVTIPIGTPLQNNTQYYVIIPNTLLRDKYNNAYAGISATNGWRFWSNDILAPTFTFVPKDGDTGVKKDAKVVITFNELVQGNGTYVLGAASGATSPFELTEGTNVLSFATATTNNDGKFTTVTLTPTVNFGSSKVITVKIKDYAVKDFGVPANTTGISQGISFVVEDYQGPVIASDGWSVPTTPTGVLKVTFSEPIYFLGGGNVTNDFLYTIVTLKNTDQNGTNVPATYSIDANKKVITITPTSPWKSEGQYYAAISSDLQDAYTNPFDVAASTRTKTFTINDVIASTVAFSANGQDLNNQAIAVGDALSMAFYEGSTTVLEAVAKVAYNNTWNDYVQASDLEKVVIFKKGSATGTDVPFTVTGSNPYTIVPGSPLSGAETYYLAIGPSTKDAAGNVNVAKEVTFTTKWSGAPSLDARTPGVDATGVAKTTTVTLTFKADVVVASSAGITINATGHSATISSVVANGKVVTITQAGLQNNKTYTVTIPSGAIVNKTDNVAYAGINWNFTTVDEVFSFAATPFTPDEITTAAINAKLVVDGETFVKGVGFIYIKKAQADQIIERIDVNSAQVVITNPNSTTSKATITPSANFEYGVDYYIELDEGVLVDKASIKNPPVAGKTPGAATWTFKTVDTELQIVKVTPRNVENVSVDEVIKVEFNRDIEFAAGQIGYIEVVSGVADQLRAYPIGSSQLSISGKVLSIAHSDKAFPANATIYLYLSAGAVDIKGNNLLFVDRPDRYNVLVDMNNPTGGYKFYTGNQLPPVPTFNPAAFSSSSPVYTNTNANVIITFNEEIYHATSGLPILSGELSDIFELRLGSASGALVNYSGTIDGRTVTLDPTSNLVENNDYVIVVIGNKVKDAAGNVLATDVTSLFKTYDATPPVVNSVTVTGGDKKLTISYSVTETNFSGGNSGFYFKHYLTSAGANPTAAEVKTGTKRTGLTDTRDITGLLASTSYDVFYVAEDSRVNITTVGKVTASTIDNVKPTLVSTLPNTGDVDVNVEADKIMVKLTFSENVGIGSGVITVKERNTQSVIGTLTQAALSAVTTPESDPKSLWLTIPVPFGNISAASAPVSLYIEISAGTVVDVSTSANAYAGIFGPNGIYFTTEDNKKPVVSKDFSGNLAIDANLKFKADENIKAGNGNAILYKNSVTPANAIEVFSAANVTINGNKIEINPAANLAANTMYYVAFNNNFVTDLSSNTNGNIYTELSFSTSNKVKPAVTVDPAAVATAISKNQLQHILVTFSEPVMLNVAGLDKPLIVLSEAEIKGQMTLVNGNGVAVPYTVTGKFSGTTSGYTINVAGADLAHLSTYKLTIKGFYDADGMVMDDASFTWKTDDGIAPVITFNPKHEQENVLPTSALTLKFSEQIYKDIIIANEGIFYAPITNDNVSALVYLWQGSNEIPFTATFNGVDLITITPSAALESSTWYSYGLVSGIYVVDNVGNQVWGGDDDTWATFKTKDVKVPEIGDVTAANFAPLGTGVAANAAMWVKFSEPFNISTGSVVIRREDGTIFQKVSGSGLSIHPDDNTKLRVAHNNFEVMTSYFVELEASVITDKSGNPNAAYSNPVDGWMFTTKDTYGLTATVTPLGDGNPNVVDLKMTFNKNVLNNPDATYGKYLAVYKADGTAIKQVEVSNLTFANSTVNYYNLQLEANESYFARIEPDAIKDASGNKFAGIMDNSWHFSTINSVVPYVVDLSPADDSKNVSPATSFKMTFSREIMTGSGKIAVRKSVDGTLVEEVDVTTAVIDGAMLTFNLSKLLNNNTDYYVIVPAGAVTNTEITKDGFEGITNVYDWNFKTGEFVCAPIKVTATLSKQMECSAEVNVMVETTYVGYELTMNGVATEPGIKVLDPGKYTFVAKTNGADCTSTAVIEVKTAPVKRTDEAETYIDEAVHYVDVESGTDTMLYAGVHVINYPNGECVRTLTVTVTEMMRTPTIAEIQGGTDNSPLAGKTVEVVATVTGVAPGEGFFMQDANAAWSGIWVEYSAATFQGIQIGNGVSVVGEVAEVANVTSLINVTFEFVPPMVSIVPVMMTSPEVTAEMYESVLVKFDGIRATAADASNGEWNIYYVAGQNIVVNDWLFDSNPVADHYYDVTGIVNGRLDNFKLEPRIEPDVKDLTLTSVDPIEENTFKVYPNPFNDRIMIDNNDKVTRVVINNIAGQRVIDIEYPNREIRTANLVSGIYVISIYTENGIAKTERMIKR